MINNKKPTGGENYDKIFNPYFQKDQNLTKNKDPDNNQLNKNKNFYQNDYQNKKKSFKNNNQKNHNNQMVSK